MYQSNTKMLRLAVESSQGRENIGARTTKHERGLTKFGVAIHPTSAPSVPRTLLSTEMRSKLELLADRWKVRFYDKHRNDDFMRKRRA